MAASTLQRDLLSGLPPAESLAEDAHAQTARDSSEDGCARVAPPSVAQVYESHGRYVFRCLRGLGVRPAHVEDAVQDVFVVVNDKLAGFDGKAKLSTWLYAIVLRVARKYRARQASEGHAAASEALDVHDAEAALISRQELTLALSALNALTDEKREVFVLAEVEQMSAPEIAAITFAPLNTVYSRLRAARFEFERRLAQLAQRAEALKSGRSR